MFWHTSSHCQFGRNRNKILCGNKLLGACKTLRTCSMSVGVCVFAASRRLALDTSVACIHIGRGGRSGDENLTGDSRFMSARPAFTSHGWLGGNPVTLFAFFAFLHFLDGTTHIIARGNFENRATIWLSLCRSSDGSRHNKSQTMRTRVCMHRGDAPVSSGVRIFSFYGGPGATVSIFLRCRYASCGASERGMESGCAGCVLRQQSTFALAAYR